jgi:signal transduction histidine kinase
VGHAIAVLGCFVSVSVGVLVLRAHPRHPVGWLLVAHGVCLCLLLPLEPATSGWALYADQLLQGAWPLLFLWLVLIAYVLPDGRTANRFWRRWVRAGLVGMVLFVVGAAGDRTGFEQTHGNVSPPLPWLPGPVSTLMGGFGLALVAALIFGSPVAVWRRLRVARGVERLQLLWFVWGALLAPIAVAIGWISHFLLADRAQPLFVGALGLAAVALPVTIGLAITRYQLFDIQLVLSRTLTYFSLVIGVVGLYALLLFVAERMFGDRTIGGLLAVGVVAVAVHPVYSWLRERIERWVYGLRSDPRVAIRLLADRVDAADPDGLITALTESVAAAVNVDRVQVETPESADKLPSPALRVPMVHRGQRVGELAIDMPPGREFSRADLDLVNDLARYAAVLVTSDQLNRELRESRSRIVTGREEERRRLRRELHDGLGPSLAAIVLRLNAAQSRTDDTERNQLIAETRDEVKEAIAEVRRLVDDLRPPAIDEVGLLGAIRQCAIRLSGDVAFEISGPAEVSTLPAAVEVAAFRIASEAMTNVARHSGATRCRVVVAIGGTFDLTVTDNGHGADPTTAPGVGWVSMRERAAELGGSCTITSRGEGGLVVRAVLPLANQPDQELEDAP